VLPMFDVDASDEALFANLDWIKANAIQAGKNSVDDLVRSRDNFLPHAALSFSAKNLRNISA